MHCSKCKATWWSAEHLQRTYDFGTFDRAVKSFVGDRPLHGSNTSPLFPEQVSNSFSKRQIMAVPALTVYRYEDTFLQINRQVKGVVFIKSPKGTGKTAILPQLLAPYRSRFMSVEDMEEKYDDEGPPQSLKTDVE